MRCPYCGSEDLVTEDGQVVCRVCGTVIVDKLVDLGPEWRSFEPEKARAGPAQENPNNLGGAIALRLSERFRPGLRALAKLHTRVVPNEEGELRSELARQAAVLGLPLDCVSEALTIYRACRDLLAGRPVNVQSLALLMIVAKRRGFTLRLKPTLRRLGLTRRVSLVNELYNALATRLGVRGRAPIEALIVRAVERLGLPFETATRAIQLLKKVPPRYLGGKSSGGIAAALVWLACNGKCLEGLIASALGVSPLTVKTRARELARTLGVSVPN